MEFLNSFFFFCFGAVLASFLNLCIYRIEKELPFSGILSGKSFCENCKKDLKWFELIPVFSFLFLKGKCSICKGKISLFNLFSEIFLGLIFFFFFFFNISLPFYIFLLILYFWAVYDFHFQNIPKTITDIILILSFVYWLFVLFLDFDITLVYPVVFSLIIGLVIYLISFKKTLFGLGDLLVILVLAFWLNSELFFSTLFFSFVVGGIFSILLVLKDRSYLKRYIPFLPFVFLGFVLALISNYAGFKVFEYILGMC